MLANKNDKLAPVLADMHMNGVYFDPQILRLLNADSQQGSAEKKEA